MGLKLCLCIHCAKDWVCFDNSGVDIHRNPVCSIELKELICCKSCEINVGKVADYIVCDVVSLIVKGHGHSAAAISYHQLICAVIPCEACVILVTNDCISVVNLVCGCDPCG